MRLPSVGFRRLDTGLYVPRRQRRYTRPIAVDLFSGAGGMSLGLIQAGWHVLAGMDNEPEAAITYLTNLAEYGNLRIHCATVHDRERLDAAIRAAWGWNGRRADGIVPTAWVAGSGWRSGNPGAPPVEHFFFGDARRWTGAEMLRLMDLEPGELDCVCGGPPCQGFSMAGKRNVMDPRNSLVFEFVRLVLELQPKTFIFENVPGIMSMVTPEGVPVVDAMCLGFEQGGFGTAEALRRSLLASAGTGAAMRGAIRRRRPRKRKQNPRVQLEPALPGLEAAG